MTFSFTFANPNESTGRAFDKEQNVMVGDEIFLMPLICDDQLDHFALAHADLLADWRVGSADGIGKETH